MGISQCASCGPSHPLRPSPGSSLLPVPIPRPGGGVIRRAKLCNENNGYLIYSASSGLSALNTNKDRLATYLRCFPRRISQLVFGARLTCRRAADASVCDCLIGASWEEEVQRLIDYPRTCRIASYLSQCTTITGSASRRLQKGKI
jgi:hypothetical protein